MNEELTNEVLEAMKKCNHDCSTCSANKVCIKCDWKDVMQSLATALLEERDKPKVWDGAPEWAKIGRVYWTDGYEREKYSKLYNRELPKTRARRIAEKEAGGLAEKYGWNESTIELVTNVMESALNKYAEELEGKE